MDLLFHDQITSFLNTTDLHSSEDDRVFHVPALFGDDFAYMNSSHNFLYIDVLNELLRIHSKERYGINIAIKYSTVDEYLQDVHKSPQ